MDKLGDQKHIDQAVTEAIDGSLGDKYLKKHAVGRGSYGEVWLLERKEDKKPFVAKVMAHEKKHRFDAEVQCLASCNHFGIVKLEGKTDTKLGPVMLLEFCDGGDLSKYIKDRSKKEPVELLSEDYVGSILVQLILSLHHIHASRMMHRDIKSANVLLCRNGLVKLSDFGFSRQFASTVSIDVADTFLGTPYYLAPELWKRHKYSKKADIFSLGVILYELLTLKRPFTSKNMPGLMQAIVQGDYDPPSSKYSDGVRGLLGLMLNVDPEKRPSTSQLLLDPTVSQYFTQFIASVKNSGALSASEKESIVKAAEGQITDIAKDPNRGVSPSRTPTTDEKEDDAESEVILEGAVSIGSVKDWKPRYVQLIPSALVVSRVKSDRKSQKVALDTITKVSHPTLGSDGVDEVISKTVLVITLTTNYTIWIKAAEEAERDQWLSAITAATQAVHDAKK